MSRPADLSHAATMAYRLLIRAEVNTLPVDPLALLRRCRDTQTVTYLEAAEQLSLSDEAFLREFGDAEAFTLCQQGEQGMRRLVIYRPDGNPARLRFTLAHELGHIALGHRGEDAAEEREADCFASHLLCPRSAVKRLAERFRPLYAEQVADACYVSLTCARRIAADSVEVDANLLDATDTLLQDSVMAYRPRTLRTDLHALRF